MASTIEGDHRSGREGWHDRRRLPHFDNRRVTQAITFGLLDALPRHLIERWRVELEHLPLQGRTARWRERVAACLDEGHGACWLRDPRVADIVERAFLHFDGSRYRLLAWCVMPSHVHVLIDPAGGHAVATIVRSWKSFTAHRANAVLGRSGAFWQREYHDRYMRDAEHVARAIEYIEENPVRAGLVGRPGEWRHSSAWRRREERGWPGP